MCFGFLLAACSSAPQTESIPIESVSVLDAAAAQLHDGYFALETDKGSLSPVVLAASDEAGAMATRGTEIEHATIDFYNETPGIRYLWVRARSIDGESAAISLGLNGTLTRFDLPLSDDYEWFEVVSVPFEGGVHAIGLGAFGLGTRVDKFVVSELPSLKPEQLEELFSQSQQPINPAPPQQYEPPVDPEDPSGPEPSPEPPRRPSEPPAPVPQDPTPPAPTPPEPTPPAPTPPEPTPPAPTPPEPTPPTPTPPEPTPPAPTPPAPTPPAPTPPEPTPPAPTPPAGTSSDLRGNPSFSPSSLSSAARSSYDALWSVIRNPSGQNPTAWASSDDLYVYARTLHTHIQSLLLAFRVTGDLALLDEVDRLTTIMRSKLHDSWRGTRDGSSQRDGYLNWVWRGSDDKTHAGKDLNELDEMKTHALIAVVAYALDLNRDLRSPGGRNYGASADYWEDYLVNHFEKKWRSRHGKASGFPFMVRPHAHTYHSWLKWHYYMGLLTGKSGYTREAERMAGIIWNRELKTVSTSTGTAYVWARSIVSEGGGENYLQPTTYARYVYADIVELHLEGFGRWADTSEVRRFANTVSGMIIDKAGRKSSYDWFSSDIGGRTARAGIRVDSSWERMDVYKYQASGFPLIMAWDTSGRMKTITDEVRSLVGGIKTAEMAAAYLLLNTYGR
ncbi:MAG: hypothetical protein KF813_14480 [Trueperaceae bacterium]|nr:hypothetical protein [Trueperaceae bacterium]